VANCSPESDLAVSAIAVAIPAMFAVGETNYFFYIREVPNASHGPSPRVPFVLGSRRWFKRDSFVLYTH
jgi:hypothetical protein